MPENNKISDAEFGTLSIQRSLRAQRILFKVRNNALLVVIPQFLRCDNAYIQGLVDKNRNALRRLLSRASDKTSDTTLYNGKVISLVEGDIHIVADNNVGLRNVKVYNEGDKLVFAYNPTHDLAEEEFAQGFSRFILRQITQRYGHVLRQMVAEYAKQFALQVKEVRIGRGSRTLGHCSRSGVITISAYVLFFPMHLRQYIVCHELAHLTHFNHSPAFHRLCNEYCQGNEAIWRKEMRQFRFPISL